ncbi:PfkB family carbohydrate kinase [Xylanimonas allomyrinae]|nr:PfkB family carbohydrate kinase [Xylanimonas allomyrinae]
MDVVTRVARIPRPGETVTAESLTAFPGGKGLNQAIAARRAGAATVFVAALGADEHGETLAQVIRAEGIDDSAVRRQEGPTGTAFVTTEASGENNIVIVAGANDALRGLTDGDRALIAAADVLVCQLEVPDSVVHQAIAVARASGTRVVLNPAPVRTVPAVVLADVDVLVVNEHEAQHLGVRDLRVRCVLTTMGAAGAELDVRGSAPVRIEARPTVAVDTTGAGDTFVGVFAADVAAGAGYEAAARRAAIAASLSVESHGAVPSIPTRADVDAAMAAPCHAAPTTEKGMPL